MLMECVGVQIGAGARFCDEARFAYAVTGA